MQVFTFKYLQFICFLSSCHIFLDNLYCLFFAHFQLSLHHCKYLFLGNKIQYRERRHLAPVVLERRPHMINHVVDDDETVVDLAHIF